MTTFVRAHALDFMSACERVVSTVRKQLAESRLPLAIGCGIACGILDRVFLFGRFDFIGRAANEAAKLQQHAWNEICVTDEFRASLKLDGRASEADWALAGKGWRLQANEISDAQPPAAAGAPKICALLNCTLGQTRVNRTRALLIVSFVVACLQIPILLVGNSAVGTAVYKLMVLSLNLVDQPLAPTLKASVEGWPIPTLVGYSLYTIFSAGVIFVLVWGATAALVRPRKQ